LSTTLPLRYKEGRGKNSPGQFLPNQVVCVRPNRAMRSANCGASPQNWSRKRCVRREFQVCLVGNQAPPAGWARMLPRLSFRRLPAKPPCPGGTDSQDSPCRRRQSDAFARAGAGVHQVQRARRGAVDRLRIQQMNHGTLRVHRQGPSLSVDLILGSCKCHNKAVAQLRLYKYSIYLIFCQEFIWLNIPLPWYIMGVE